MTEKSKSTRAGKSKSVSAAAKGSRKAGNTGSAKKKTAAKKKSSTAAKKKVQTSGTKKSGTRALKWDLLVFMGIVAMVVAVAAYYRYNSRPGRPGYKRAVSTVEKRQADPVKVLHPQTPKMGIKPDFEVFPPKSGKVSEPEPSPVHKPQPAENLPDHRPMVAIIIDDLGYEMDVAEKFLSIDGPLTYAILPQSPFYRQIAESAHNRGCQVMLHLPMEPREYPEVDPGPGALLTDMSADERIGLLKSHLDSVPYISGVNNHMGSKMSEDSAQMNQLLSIIKKRRLFYIDSLTSAQSRSLSSARLFKVPFARRDVFLDHEQTSDFVRSQVNRLVAIAHKKGKAVGIGHPYPVTYETLEQMLPEIKKQVRLVHASEIVSVDNS
jgi:hypothetical protein